MSRAIAEAHARLLAISSEAGEIALALEDVRRPPTYASRQVTESRTFTGQEISYWSPEAMEVLWLDLKVGMREVRYCGQLGTAPWTVAHHLALCGRLAPADSRIRALAVAHDLHEAYVKDLPKGLKECLGSTYATIEGYWEQHVHRELGLWPISPTEATEVKRIDVRALALEMSLLGWHEWPPARRVLDASGGPITETEHLHFMDVSRLEDPFARVQSVLETYKPGRLR